jgi:hypothetical protein
MGILKGRHENCSSALKDDFRTFLLTASAGTAERCWKAGGVAPALSGCLRRNLVRRVFHLARFSEGGWFCRFPRSRPGLSRSPPPSHMWFVRSGSRRERWSCSSAKRGHLRPTSRGAPIPPLVLPRASMMRLPTGPSVKMTMLMSRDVRSSGGLAGGIRTLGSCCLPESHNNG